jgi:hypothetical protein
MLPNLSLLEQVRWKIRNTPNKQGEYKRKTHYCCYLLCEKAGLRVSEAINFNLNTKTRKGLYLLNKTKGRKKRFVYIPQKVINELKKHHWKPNSTNRFNFYHFLKRIKQELRISTSTELTPHTLRRAFATYHAESGLPLPLLSKLLGHKSIRTTALYWMNIHHDDDDDNDAGNVLAGKIFLERPKKPLSEPETPINLNLGESPELLTPNLLASEPRPNYLSKIKHLKSQLTEKDQKMVELVAEKKTLQNDLTHLSEQNAYETTQRERIQQELTTAKQAINQLAQDLAQERQISNEQKQIIHNIRQQLSTEQEINANFTKKLHAYEQNYLSLTDAYQNALKDKQTAEEKLNHLLSEVKNAFRLIFQWQKFNYYKQLESKQGELKAQIVQPPPGRINK